MNEIIAKIEQWGEDRNLIKGSTPLDQGMKLFSEYGELCDAIAKNQIELIKDGIGDVLVVCTIISKQIDVPLTIDNLADLELLEPKRYIVELGFALNQFVYGTDSGDLSTLSEDKSIILSTLDKVATAYGLTLQQCLEHAYNDIKDRRGLLHNGVFIKSDDPRYAELGGK
ncbi:MAG: hypothetical protein [Bacteriophage sp.]|nr:MAG: hypothetical protein [Bacteriophage sp.]